MSSSLRNAAGNTTGISAGPPYAERRFADLVNAQGDSSQNVTTQTDANNAVVTTYSDNNSAGPPSESTKTANLNTQAENSNWLADDGIWVDDTQRIEKANENMKDSDYRDTTVKITSSGGPEYSSQARPHSNFKVTNPKVTSTVPAPITKNVRGKERIRWADIQAALNNQILPNELYDDGSNEYELTAYMITIFMISEGEFMNKDLDAYAAELKEVPKGAVVIAASAGSDEFYVDDLEFTSYCGTAGIIANRFSITIRSPFQADLIDHIFRAGRWLNIQNHMDAPMFCLINWNARETETSDPKRLNTVRCIPFRIIKAGLTYDDAGGAYEIDAIRYSEHNAGTTLAVSQEDITFKGKTVAEALSGLLTNIGNTFSKAIDMALFPDEYKIEVAAEWAPLELVTDKQEQHSDKSTGTNDPNNELKSVPSQAFQGYKQIVPSDMAANSSHQTPKDSEVQQNEAKLVRNFEYKSGTAITTMIKDILESTKKYQQEISAHEVDPQADDAQQYGSKEGEIKRYHIGFDFKTEILEHDPSRNKYQCIRTFIARKRLDPSLAKDKNATLQTKVLSKDRLYAILGEGLLKKAYPYYWSGLNTEIKTLDFSFDNHWINAQNLFSKMQGPEKRQHGVKADVYIHKGATAVDWNMVRDHFSEKKKLTEAIGAAKKRIKSAEAAMGGFENDRLMDIKKHTELEIKRLEGQVDINLDMARAAATRVANARRKEAEIRIAEAGTVYMGDLESQGGDEGVLFPIPQLPSIIPKQSTGTREDYDRGYNILSEIMAKKEGGDMVEVDLEIRGDPYWIPEKFHKANFNSISPTFQQPYLLILSNSITDYNNAGIFQINERSSLNAIYFVTEVENRFSGGEFSQVLKCKRDLTVEINSVLREPIPYHDAIWDHSMAGLGYRR